MIKKGILLLIITVISFVSCSTSDDSSTSMEDDTNNDTIIVEQLSTNSGFANDIVSITGSNFLSQLSNITVRFSSTVAEITTVTDTRIDIKVPYNLTATNHPVVLVILDTEYDLGLFNIIQEIQLLAASSNGKIYELGASSGNITLIGSTDYNFLSAFASVNILKHQNTIYFFDTYSPGTSRLITYNLLNNTSESQELVFPSEIVGDELGIIAFEYDTITNDIVAIVNENVISSNQNLNYIVRINPVTYQVSNTGFTFEQINISSSILKNNFIYATSLDDDFEIRKINLNSGVSETVELSNSYKISQLVDNGSYIYGVRSSIIAITGIVPIQLNPDTFEVTDFTPNNNTNYSLTSFFGNSFINNDTAYSVIASNEFNVGLLKFNTSTNTYNTQGLNGNSIESNLRILDVIN